MAVEETKGKHIKRKKIGRGHPSQRAASAVPWEGQPCFKKLILLLLLQEALQPKCNVCRPARSPEQTPAVLQALQLRMSLAQHLDLGDRGDRREQLITAMPERKYSN